MMVEKAIKVLKKGGVIIYPTETFYAVGCVIYNRSGIKRIFDLKKRDFKKVLPIIIGDLSQLKYFTDTNNFTFLKLIDIFWPGPLSILVPGIREIPTELMDSRGFVCVRMTPHPIAKKLCVALKAPLISTSANISGEAPVSDPCLLDKGIVGKVDIVITDPPFPEGICPSTVVEILDFNELKILREGCITMSDLKRQGFRVV